MHSMEIAPSSADEFMLDNEALDWWYQGFPIANAQGKEVESKDPAAYAYAPARAALGPFHQLQRPCVTAGRER